MVFPSAYKTTEQLYQALENEEVQGILLDLFIASYAQANIAKNDVNFIMAKFFEYSYWNMVWARKPFRESISGEQETNTFSCFHEVLRDKRDNDVYVVVQKYIRGRSLEVGTLTLKKRILKLPLNTTRRHGLRT